MLLSIIIVSYNTKELLEACLDSIKASLDNQKNKKIKNLSLSDIEVIIVDNNSTDGTREYLKQLTVDSQKLKVKTILNNDNVGFARANNQGIRRAEGKYILFLNPDTIVYPNTLDKTIEYLASNPRVGLITCRVELADGSLQKECHRGFPTPWRAFCHFFGLGRLFPKSKLFSGYFLGHLPQNTTHKIDACVGAFMITKKEIGDLVGWWDEDFFWYGDDLDLCYRIKKAGYEVVFYPEVKITHYQGASSGIKKTQSRANKETKKKVMIASVEAMRVFYQKHYQNKYPRVIGWLVMKGIGLLEKIRLRSVEKQFK